MAERPYTKADLDVLAQWDTPTICNGLEITSPERAPSATPSSRWSACIRWPSPSSAAGGDVIVRELRRHGYRDPRSCFATESYAVSHHGACRRDAIFT